MLLLPEKKTDDMITSRAMDDSTLQNAEVLSSPQYSDLNKSASKEFLVQEQILRDSSSPKIRPFDIMQLTKVDSTHEINNIGSKKQLMNSKSKLKLKKKFLLSPQRNGVPILPNI